MERDSRDEFADDLKHPQAFPLEPATDLMGRIRVRLRAVDDGLQAYGWGDQRIDIDASWVGAVCTVDLCQVSSTYGGRIGSSYTGKALLVLDKQHRILLRAPGRWAAGDLRRVCQAAGLPLPTHKSSLSTQEALACETLNTAPLTRIPLRLATAAVGACAGWAGWLPALALPRWLGEVRLFAGIAGAMLGIVAGLWLCETAGRLAAAAVRWAVVSWQAGRVAPPGQFVGSRREPGLSSLAVTVAMVAFIPALVVFGPGVAMVSGVHGIADSNLVAELRAGGVRTDGFLIDDRGVATSIEGKPLDTPTLSFKAGRGNRAWLVPDPPIGGRTLPLDASDPRATHVPVTVVYLPDDPHTAAAAQQLAGSVWHGAPTANVIAGIVFTPALGLLIWRLAVRIRRKRLRAAAGLLSDIA